MFIIGLGLWLGAGSGTVPADAFQFDDGSYFQFDDGSYLELGA
jgi:hypothetical protein